MSYQMLEARQAVPSPGGPPPSPEQIAAFIHLWLTPNLASLVVAGPLWGLVIALSWASVHHLTKHAQSIGWRRRHFVQIAIVSLMMTISTISYGLLVAFDFSIFVEQDVVPGSVSPPILGILTLTVVQQLVLDGTLLYRAYIVYESIWYVVPVIFTWLSVMGLGFYSLFLQGIKHGSLFEFDLLTYKISVAYAALALAHNSTCSGLILYRIFSVARTRSRIMTYKKSISLIIETGFVYSAIIVMLLIFLVRRSTGLIAGIICFAHIGACIFCGMILQTQKIATESEFVSNTHSNTHSRTRSGDRSYGPSNSLVGTNYSMQRMTTSQDSTRHQLNPPRFGVNVSTVSDVYEDDWKSRTSPLEAREDSVVDIYGSKTSREHANKFV